MSVYRFVTFNRQSDEYCFVIHDAITRADIYCYKPDQSTNNLTLLDTKDKVIIPPDCKVVVLKQNMDRLMQADIFPVVQLLTLSSRWFMKSSTPLWTSKTRESRSAFCLFPRFTDRPS